MWKFFKIKIFNLIFNFCLLEFMIIENIRFSLIAVAIKVGMIHTHDCMPSKPNH